MASGCVVSEGLNPATSASETAVAAPPLAVPAARMVATVNEADSQDVLAMYAAEFSSSAAFTSATSSAANKENLQHDTITTISTDNNSPAAPSLNAPSSNNGHAHDIASVTADTNAHRLPHSARLQGAPSLPPSHLNSDSPQTAAGAMDNSQEMTQPNDGRDYEATAEDDSLGDFGNESLVKGDRGAVDFGLDACIDSDNGHETMSDPLSPIADIGLVLTRGNWRSVETPSQRNSLGFGTTPFRRRPFGDPVTPMTNNNPFANMNLQQSEMRPSQLFLGSDPQLPSAVKMNSPTSSRPSPVDFNNSPAPICQSSPTQLRRRAPLQQPFAETFPSPLPALAINQKTLDAENEVDVIPGSPIETPRVHVPMRRHHSSYEARDSPLVQTLKRKAGNANAISDDSDFEGERATSGRNLAARKRRKADQELERISVSNTTTGPASTSGSGSVNSTDKLPSHTAPSLPIQRRTVAASEAAMIPDSDEVGPVIANSQLSVASDTIIKASVEPTSTTTSAATTAQQQKETLLRDTVPETSPPPTGQSTTQPVPSPSVDTAENDIETADEAENEEEPKSAPPHKSPEQRPSRPGMHSDDEPLFTRLKLPLTKPSASTSMRSLKSPTVSPLTSAGDHIPDTQVPSSSPTRRTFTMSRENIESAPVEQERPSDLEPSDGRALEALPDTTKKSNPDTDVFGTPKLSKKIQSTYSRRNSKPKPPPKVTPVPPPILSVDIFVTNKSTSTKVSKPTRKRQRNIKAKENEASKLKSTLEATPEPSAPAGTEDTPPRLPPKRPRGKANRVVETSEPPEDKKPEKPSSTASKPRKSSTAARLRTQSPAGSDRRSMTPHSEAADTTSTRNSPVGKKRRASVRSRASLQQREPSTKSQPAPKQNKKKPAARKSAVSRRTAKDSSDDELLQTPPEIEDSTIGVPTPVTEPHVARRTDTSSKRSSKGWAYLPVEENSEGLFSNMVFALTFQSRELVSPAYEYERRVRINKDIEKKLMAAGGRVLESGFEEMFHKASTGTEPSNTDVLQTPLALTEAAKKHGFTAVIADGYSRKVKYMQALALGIPCITYHWVEECIRKNDIVAWQPFLLTSGASICFDNAMMSRTLHPFSPAEAMLSEMIEHRPRFLAGQRILFVIKRSRDEEKKRFYLFLMHVLGATVSRALSVTEARASLANAEACKEPFDWLYLDEPMGNAAELLEAGGAGRAGSRTKGGAAARKKKRESTVDTESEAEAALVAGLPNKLRLMSNELVVQSLIRGDMIDVETWASVNTSAGSAGKRR
ncbi:hypothetical protein BROUX41_004659 [Berkeleyomyces rouxiae]|uniref:uncharacterized protein n=1 Tax=Berkeleyomyces rouxiae TaxID=2035830 RepID=UPI003B81DED4